MITVKKSGNRAFGLKKTAVQAAPQKATASESLGTASRKPSSTKSKGRQVKVVRLWAAWVQILRCQIRQSRLTSIR
jgi:hypothetical protein